MNGTILGMRKAEIDRKFDEIVAFSEIEEFLDTPVKRYSSGMYVRLAFAVAAHLEPEILIVDEVLAVGDYSFQKKCLGKMQDVASGDGRTILFVSHNMGTLAQLCQRGILLKEGSVAMNGPIRDVIGEFLQSMSEHRAAGARFAADDPSKPCQFLSAAILRDDGSLGSEFGCDESFTVRLELEVRRPVPGLKVYFDLYTMDGIRLLNSDARDGDPAMIARLGVGRHTFDVRVPGQILAPTTYLMNIACYRQGSEVIDHHESCCEFSLHDTVSSWPHRPGLMSLMLPWQHRSDAIADRDVPPAAPPEPIRADRPAPRPPHRPHRPRRPP